MAETIPIYNRHDEEFPRILVAEEIAPSFGQNLLPGAWEVHNMAGKLDSIQAVVDHIRRERINYFLLRSGFAARGDEFMRLCAEMPEFVGVGRAGIGVDNIDVCGAINHGVLVQNTPEASVESVGEHALALAFALLKRIVPMTVAGQRGLWEKQETRELRGMKVLAIGAGRIGTDTASKFDPFGCKVKAYDPFTPHAAFLFGRKNRGSTGHFVNSATARALLDVPQMQIFKKPDELHDLLAEADIVTIHINVDDLLEPVLGRDEIARLKPGAFIINTSRKEAVDHEALIAAAVEKGIGIGLDVLPKEKKGFADDPLVIRLLELQSRGLNIAITHHVAGNTEEAQDRIGVESAGNVNDLFRGGMLHNVVNAPQTLVEPTGENPRLFVLNKDRQGATRVVAAALESAGINVHSVAFGPLPKPMRTEKMDMLGFELDVNGRSPAYLAAEVQAAIARISHDDASVRELLVKALIL